MKKRCVLALVLIMLLFAGCAPVAPNPPAEPTPIPIETPIASPDVSPAPTEETFETATAVYVGRADLNFIEILMNGKYISAKLSDEIKDKFAGLNIGENDKIKITYAIEDGIYEVHEISKK